MSDPLYTASTAKEIYSLLPSGQLLRDTGGTIVPDATFTIVQFTDCDMNPIPHTSDILEINAMGFGAYCVEYQIQQHGEAHLIALPIKAGHTFDNIQLLMKWTVSNGDLQNIGGACLDALSSTNPILTAAAYCQGVLQKVNSMIASAGQAYQWQGDALAQTTSQQQPAAAAAITAANLPAVITAALKADTKFARLLNNILGKRQYNETTKVLTIIGDDGTTLGTVTLTLDSAGKVVVSRL